jgi:reactive intermediate/imine deaminase
MHVVASNAVSPPAGHYSQAIVHGGLVFVAGQLPTIAGRPHDPSRPIGEQVRLALANVRSILEAAGTDVSHVLSATVYVVGIGNWGEVNAAYAEVFGTHRPARTTVPVPELHHGYAVEISVVAALPG